MTDWKVDIEESLRVFFREDQGASDGIARGDIEVEYLKAPHEPPQLPAGKMAVLGFWYDGVWLLIGTAGPKSRARYVSQHYNANSSWSNLAKFLLADDDATPIVGSDPGSVREWIKASTNRVNILFPAAESTDILTRLKAFLHDQLHPLYGR